MVGSDDIVIPNSTAWLADPAAQLLCETIEAEGYKAYFVGGCVRNAILNEPNSDVDLSTDAAPREVMHLARKADFHAIPTGIEFGTVTVIVDGKPFEVTTFRKDVETDGRRAVVSFSDQIEDDARRRDFTMNALYADRSGHLIDPLGGLQDAMNRRLRFIDDPVQRIREDYLRILRFFRFFAWYADPGEGADPEALNAIANLADHLGALSVERVGAEMIKLLSAPDPLMALRLMERTGVLAQVLPGAAVDLIGPLLLVEEHLEINPEPIRRLAALGVQDAKAQLRLSNAQSKELKNLHEMLAMGTGPRAIGFLLGRTSGASAVALDYAMRAQVPDKTVIEMVDDGSRAQFPVSSKDLAGQYSGPALGKKLRELQSKWLASDLSLSAEQLLG